MLLRHLRQQRHDVLRIVAVGDTERDLDAPLPVAEGPVGDFAGDQHRVRHDDLGAIAGAHHAGADADALDLPAAVGHLDRVADLDGALEQQDQAGHEVVDDALQAETDADADRAGDDGEAVEVDAGRCDRDQHAGDQQDVVQDRGQRIGDAAGHRQPAEDLLVEHEAQQARQQHRPPDGHDEGQQGAERQADLADHVLGRQQLAQAVARRLEQRHQVEGGQHPTTMAAQRVASRARRSTVDFRFLTIHRFCSGQTLSASRIRP